MPAALSRLRDESYAVYVRPRAFADAFERNGLFVTLAAAVSVAAFVLGFVALQDPAVLFSGEADFYRLMPHGAMIAVFGVVALYVIAAFTFSLRAFWRSINAGGARAGRAALWQALYDAALLRNLDGGGDGCMSEDDAPSNARRLYHHLTFYGFLACFAATCVATIYHYGYGWSAPYPVLSLPVLLGIIGGVGLLVGPAGLFALARRRAAALTDAAHRGMDTAFVVMLFLVSLSGLLLLLLRDSAAMGILLALHLGLVLGLFLSLPYGKFVHGLYRFLALVKCAAERRGGETIEAIKSARRGELTKVGNPGQLIDRPSADD
jgi:citrate/tricarballylate utilization protein